MVEAHAAEIILNDGRKIAANVVGYDNDTGFGLLKAVAPLKVRPMLFGKIRRTESRLSGIGGEVRGDATVLRRPLWCRGANSPEHGNI